MPKILMLSDITGLGPEYHVGDEAMAEIAIQRLSVLVGKENLILGCTHPEGIHPTYGIDSFAFYHTTDADFYKMATRKPLSFLKSIFTNIYQVLRCDKILICGGGNMTSVWPGILEARIRLLKVANFFKKEIYLVSQTIGPYNEAHRKLVDKTLKTAKWIGVRDLNFSKTQTSNPVKFALDDACFLQAIDNQETVDLVAKMNSFACVSMRKFGEMSDDDCIKAAKAISNATQKHGLKTVFIPHHAPKGTEGDIRLANMVEHNWPKEDFICINPIILASALKAITAKSEIVISMRYHQLIFALSSGIPSVGIYVDDYTQAKLTGSFEALGLTPLVTAIDDIEENLPKLIAQALDMKSKFELAVHGIQTKLSEDSLKPYRLMAGAEICNSIQQGNNR